MLLQINFNTADPAKLDSLKQVRHEAITLLKTDPNAFWQSFLDSAIQFGLKVLAAIVIYLIGAWIIGRVRKVLERVFRRKKTERTLASFICSLVSILLTVLLIVITISTLGVDTTSIAALLAAGGMAIGMALSGTVQNFAGGIMIQVFKPFQAGDFIDACGYKGIVMEVNIVSTKILTTDNRVVILPNGTLSNGTIDNYTAQSVRRVDIEMNVGYGTDAEAYKAAVLKVISSDERILTSKDKRPPVRGVSAVNTNDMAIPDPFVALLRFNESTITFVVRVWVLKENYWDVFFDLQQRLYNELPKQGFLFAYPHRDVRIISEKQ